jgi:lipoprotein NlpI
MLTGMTRHLFAVLAALLPACSSPANTAPDDAPAAFRRGVKHLESKDYAKAIAEFDAALKLDATLAAALDRRGDAYLKTGEFAKAIADYDAFLKLEPKFEPEHWRRGIAYYYAKKYAEGTKQFETHKTVNPQDVENAAWHYLCNSKVVGAEKARAELIAVTQDPRVPMAEIQKLFAGKLEPKDVLAAAEKLPADRPDGVSARMYANLYVGLWFESAGKAAEAKAHLTAAAEKYEIGDYMWDIAKVHAKLVK